MSLTQLHSITNRILDAEKNEYGELHAACNELYNFLLKVGGIDPLEEKNRKHVLLEKGNAIGLTWAAMCIVDLMRTKRFMDGVYEATKDALKANEGKTVHILYAGTGPFATLVLPLTARFSSSQLKFTLLEINEHSFNCLKKLISFFQLENYIHHMEIADATKWKVPANEQIDILVSETMMPGLKAEPLVAICMNLLPQLPAKTILIPEEVVLKANIDKEKKRLPVDSKNNDQLLKTVFTFNKESVLKYATANKQNTDAFFSFPEEKVSISPEIANSGPALYLLTDLVIYKQQKLLIHESQLTIPLKLTVLNEPTATEIKFRYHAGNKPHIKFEVQ